MIRHMTVVAALTVSAGAASAAFIGIDIREDKSLPSADGQPGFPGVDNIRVFNFYAMFDGPGTGMQSSPNAVLNVGQLTPDIDPLLEGFGVNLETNPNGSFYRSPPAAGGSSIGAFDADGPGDARRNWNTYVSIGLKSVNSYSGPNTIDNTAGDPDFGFHTQGTPIAGRPPFQQSNWISGGWLNSSPPSFQGEAQDLGDGTFGTFLAQISIMFPSDGDLGEWGGIMPGPETAPGEPAGADMMGTWFGEIFIGDMIIFTQDPAGGAIRNDIVFVPTPGALALFGLAGVAGLRRRR